MIRVLFFNFLQLGASVYAIAKGGAPERLIGLALLLAAGSTRVLQSGLAVRFVQVETGVAAVDLVLLGFTVAVALRADRFWPMWVVALQGLGVGAHLVKSIDADIARSVYAFLTAIGSYPIILILVIATTRHRNRIAAGETDSAWTPTKLIGGVSNDP